MGAHLNVNWVDAKVPGSEAGSRAEAYQQLADAVLDSKKGTSPSLIFVISDETRRKSSRDAEEVPTQQRKDSGAAWIELFQTEGDYSVFMPGRFFDIVRVDATQVTEADNPHIHSAVAPIVILTQTDGTVDKVLEGRQKIKRNSVISAMCAVLKKDGVVSNLQPFGKLHDLIKSLERSEITLLQADEKLQELQAKLRAAGTKDAQTAQRTKKPLKRSTTTSLAEAAVEKFKKTTIVTALIGKFKILKEEFALLKEIGLPAEKMPKEPVHPSGATTPLT